MIALVQRISSRLPVAMAWNKPGQFDWHGS
jgi:hypothetical protein